MYPEIKIETGGFKDGRYTDSDGYVWSIARLAEHAKDLMVFDLPISCIFIGENVLPKNITNAKELATHVKRVNEADLDCPVMLDPEGFIMDGWHRISKALVLGIPTIKAVRFESLPPCDFQENNNGAI